MCEAIRARDANAKRRDIIIAAREGRPADVDQVLTFRVHPGDTAAMRSYAAALRMQRGV